MIHDPLFHSSHLTYTGAFRLPRHPGFDFGGGPIAYNGFEKTLFVGARNNQLCELMIPTIHNGPIGDLEFATMVQPFIDPFNGKLTQLNTTGYDESLAGCAVTPDGDLLLSGSIYYDAGNVQRVSHFKRPRNLTINTDSGWHPVWITDRQGLVAGSMIGTVPKRLQEMLGGSMVVGQTGLPIIYRGSYGPAAFTLDPRLLGADNNSLIPATPLVYYDSHHPTLGVFEPTDGVANDVWNGTMIGTGLVIIEGLRSLLCFGRIGVGRFGYGPGTTDVSLAAPQQQGQSVGGGAYYCYDPDNSDKGQHAWPYRFQIWAYDLNELENVKLGLTLPWDVKPTIYTLTLPYQDRHWALSGVSYDSVGHRLFVGQLRADTDGFASRSIIHVFQVNVPEPIPVPVPEPTPEPARDTGGAIGSATVLDLFAAHALVGDDVSRAYTIAQRMVAEKRRRERG